MPLAFVVELQVDTWIKKTDWNHYKLKGVDGRNSGIDK